MSCVQVWCRLKPQSPSALTGSGGDAGAGEGSGIAVCIDGASGLTVEVAAGPQQPGYRLAFQLDYVFGAAALQEDIFEQLRPRVREFLGGYSATVLTYGQTGSGKTYTIQGAEAANTQGVVPRVAEMIFARCAEPGCGGMEVYVSFLEIYQEKLRDLLLVQKPAAATATSRGLRIRETAKSGIWVEGLTEKKISSTLEFAEVSLSLI
jgi:hypothetical protein